MKRARRSMRSVADLLALVVLLGALWLGRAEGLPGAEPAAGAEGRSLEAGEDPYAAAGAFAAIRGSSPSTVGAYAAARLQIMEMLRSHPIAPGAFEREWVPLGPSNVGGRVRALVIDPRNTDVLYAGGVAGGVWKSVDAGASWLPLTETFANVGVTTIAMDPNDPDILFVGTGEAFANRTAVEWPGAAPGIGIMKTEDGGRTWRLLPQTVRNPGFLLVHDIVISASDPDVLYAGVLGGLARSLDGGEKWQIVLQAESTFGCGDIAVRTDRSPDVILASCADHGPDGVYLSESGGDPGTWTKVLDEVNGERAGFSAIAFAPSDQDIAYASVARTEGSVGGGSGTLALLRSEDGGRTWPLVQNSGTPAWLSYDCNTGGEGQGSYDNVVAVDPTDPNRLWIGGIDAFRSDDGGKTITIAGYWWLDRRVPPPSPGIHADQHAIVFDPGYDGINNRTVYFGNDGGVYRTVDDRAALPNQECDRGLLIRGKATYLEVLPNVNKVEYSPLNEGLTITQFWAGTASDDGEIVMGGTQDNGTLSRPQGADAAGWTEVCGGDGFDVAISPGQDRLYCEIYGNFGIDIRRSDDGGDFVSITNTVVNPDELGDALPDSGLFFTPFVMDPKDPLILWTGGHSMWRTIDGGDTWVAAGPILSEYPDAISAIGVSPSEDVVYAGTAEGDLFVSVDVAASQVEWRGLANLGGYVTSIAVHPDDPRVAFVTIGTFDLPHVLRTTDMGSTWTDVGTDLPDIPASAVAINPLNPDMVFVGTDAGVFESPDGGATWYPANGDLVSTIVQDLVFRTGTSELYLFTHGRGAYRVDVGSGG